MNRTGIIEAPILNKNERGEFVIKGRMCGDMRGVHYAVSGDLVFSFVDYQAKAVLLDYPPDTPHCALLRRRRQRSLQSPASGPRPGQRRGLAQLRYYYDTPCPGRLPMVEFSRPHGSEKCHVSRFAFGSLMNAFARDAGILKAFSLVHKSAVDQNPLYAALEYLKTI